MTTHDLIQAYYDAFNAADMPAFLALLNDDVVHDINQGERQVGKAVFAEFMDKMNGECLAGGEGLPPANGQKYVLPAGAFFEVKNGKVARISNYYNLNDWVAQVC